MEDLTDIEVSLWAYLRENHLPPGREMYRDDMNLFDAGILDSAGLISFISFIERRFGLTVPDEDLLPEFFFSISAIASYIRSRKTPRFDARTAENT